MSTADQDKRCEELAKKIVAEHGGDPRQVANHLGLYVAWEFCGPDPTDEDLKNRWLRVQQARRALRGEEEGA